ncbi:MAG: response regulator [Planctomyces sp.]|nr:response regulator [Planctomyces sp.]
MSSHVTGSTDSVLDEIRSTIASFESLRSAASARRKLTDADSIGSQDSPVVPERSHVNTPQPVVPVACPAQPVVQPKKPDPFYFLNAKSLPRKTFEYKESEPDTDGTEELLKSEVAPVSTLPKAPTVHVSQRAVDKSAKIMIVDDEPLNVMTFRQHLKMEGYENFITTSNAREALQLLRSQSPDVLLLDIRMPQISGLDILRVVGLDPILQHIPVLILTAASDPATRKEALDLGASDFLQKPIDPNELLPRVRNALVIKKHYDLAASEAARLEQQVERRTRQLDATRQQLILCLARAAEHRDNDTGNHVIRVGRYTSLIAKQMGYPEHHLEMLEQAAQLHDVGKIGIPDSILFKPGRLAVDEYEMLKRHCALGKQIIEPISEKEWNILKTHTRIGESMLHVRSSSLLMLAARIAQTHHERWDGTGYPLGLQGEDIPFEARLVAVADVFDALSSRRPYKEPFPRQKCFDIIAKGRGTQFDPAVVDAFFECSEQIIEVQLLLMDEEDRVPKGEWKSAAGAELVDDF